ncbi:bifunctional 4-hydroxy-2-oxoglutarate aldolase/2-dehydro-3-deoxy-phosphogluconate aldolase [candidate division KSB1 bacterium]|nr:bifunctional 4-hydroxy-2-oxoglutarate aldolase/2-dehydro-3-deoxy-phosphogluconate aldolase [candidate division KSB1 bacterium]
MRQRSERIYNILKENQLIALLSPLNVTDCVTAYEVLSPMGIILEIAFRTQAALEGIRAILQKYPDALVLAGTVLTRKQASDAIQSGVAGIVSPDYFQDVVACCVEQDVLCVPGGHGDVGKQLVQKADLYECGLDQLRTDTPYQWIFKLFPSVTNSVSYIDLSKAWKSVYKELQLVYTGGISLSNLEEIVQHDPTGFYCGSALTKHIENPAKMHEEAQKWKEIIQKQKNKV